MSKRRFFLTLTIICIVGSAFFLLRRKAALQPDFLAALQPTARPPTVLQGAQPETPKSTASTPVVPPPVAPPPLAPLAGSVEVSDQENMQKLASVLFEFSRPQRTFNQLIQYLRTNGQEPFVARDANESTGEMMIVRTKSPFSGTRYFHAQYFSDNGQERFLQHMSFEVPKGPQAMAQALQAVKTAFPGLGQAKVQSPDLLTWDAGDGYTVWIKRLKAEELRDNPFNAYTKDDVGTLRIAIEATPEIE